MKSRREIGLSFLHPNRSLSPRGIGDPRIRVREALAYILVFALAVVAVGGFLRWHIASLYQHDMASWRARLSSIADDQAQRVSDWLREREEDAQVLATHSSVRAVLHAYYGVGQLPKHPPGSLPELTAVLDNLARLHPYAGVYVLDRDAHVVAQSSDSAALGPLLAEICRSVTGVMRINLLGDARDRSLISFSVPVFPGPVATGAGRPPGQLLGIVLVVSDASRTLFPLVTREVVPTRTSETVLVRREGNDTVYFSPLRHVPPGSPNLRIPLSTAPRPARLALEGREIFVEYNDYRGVPVLAATQHIPVTGWGLVRKIDRAEALEDFRRGTVAEGLAAGLLIILVGGLLLFHRREVLTRVLKQEEEKFRALLESAPDAVYIIEPSSLRILRRNRKAAEMDGYSDEEIAHMSATDLHPSEERHLLPERFGNISETGLALPVYVLRHRRKDGQFVPIEERQTLVEVGGERFVVSIVRNITERKRAEIVLQESEERYRSLVENATVGIYRTTPQGRILMANPTLVRMLGYEDFTELAARNLDEQEFEPSYPRRAFREQIERHGEVKGLEAAWTRRDGLVIFVRESARVVRDESGNVLCYDGIVEDITDRKQAEEALIEERHLLHTLMDNLPDVIYFKDRESHFTRINKAHAKLFGLRDPAQAAGKTDFDFFTAEHAQEAYNDEQQIIRTGQPVVGKEEKETWPDGHVTWVSTTKMPLRDASGNIVGTFGVSHDITQRKRGEEDLYESRQMLKSILDTIPQRVFWKDRNIVYLGCNKAFAIDAGLKDPAEIIGKNDYELAWRETAERFRADDKLVMDQQTPRLNFEEPQNRPDGSQWWLRTNKLPLRDREGKVIGMTGTYEDITERKRAEAEHIRLVTAIEQSAAAVVITNTAGDIEYVNPAFTRITGYSRDEVFGQNPRILKSGKQDPGFYEQLWATILKGEIWHGELINQRKDGSLYTEQMNIAPVRGAGGEVTHFIATKQDVTEHKQLEQQFIQAQKIEAVGRLAGGVAHDFNNLLTIINGYAQLLTERISPEDPRRGHLKEILMAGERAASLTRQLLAFSRRQVLEPRVLNLNSVLAEVTKMLRRLIGEDVELVSTLKPDLGRVKVDPGQIEQVIMNLAVNARDAMPQGGKLFIETSNVEIDANYARSHSPMMPGKYVMVAVSDTGCGMDLETQAHIFEPFFTTKEKGRGTGLGLATVYGIVKQSGGFIWVYSAPGRGSTFKIYLPVVEEALPTAEAVEVPAELAKGSETVLVVEDEGGVRSLVCETLASHGYKVLEAAGAASALEISEQYTEPIHLLLTDVVMPQTGGKELAKGFSTLHPETKVLYMSGYTDDAIVRHGILEGGTSFLQKPFPPRALLLKIREVLKMNSGTQQF